MLTANRLIGKLLSRVLVRAVFLGGASTLSVGDRVSPCSPSKLRILLLCLESLTDLLGLLGAQVQRDVLLAWKAKMSCFYPWLLCQSDMRIYSMIIIDHYIWFARQIPCPNCCSCPSLCTASLLQPSAWCCTPSGYEQCFSWQPQAPHCATSRTHLCINNKTAKSHLNLGKLWCCSSRNLRKCRTRKSAALVVFWTTKPAVKSSALATRSCASSDFMSSSSYRQQQNSAGQSQTGIKPI